MGVIQIYRRAMIQKRIARSIATISARQHRRIVATAPAIGRSARGYRKGQRTCAWINLALLTANSNIASVPVMVAAPDDVLVLN